MQPAVSGREYTLSDILQVVRRYWGFDRLRPLQEEAILAGLEHRDSLVVLPTGGGKSLCYQVPPLLAGRLDIVVSPLISLMKDQVDALRACGYPAVALHSAMTASERGQALRALSAGECRLALVSPERLVTERFLELITNRQVGAFAVDEAHCISHWGHDFRPEYRQLSMLKERFPGASIHAYTATATERVQKDIVEQLLLEDPLSMVGRFDRPNLVYRVVPRQDGRSQIGQVLERHRDEAAIIYCVTRKETERLTCYLTRQGFGAACYHAGLGPAERREIQDAFSKERIQVIVATVAFGMGIDRSDVRCVIHAGMPRSIEHYQQETGRAGRDGLEAECILFCSPADVLLWKSILEKKAAEAGTPSEVLEASLGLLDHMRRYCAPGRCRHRVLSEYFDQPYGESSCGACDVCLQECQGVEDGTVAARMVLSCVVRVGERFGITHVVDVLRGAESQQIKRFGHDQLSTYGLMKTLSPQALTNVVYQLVDQGLLVRTDGKYPILRLNDVSRQVLRGERKVQLVPVKARKVKRTRHEKASWEGVDRDLFESLRQLRTRLARHRGVPPYIIFNDATLREMTRRRPQNGPALLAVPGVGEKKLVDFGEAFLRAIREHCGRSTEN